MIMTAEITMYPFDENFVPPIKQFIDKLSNAAADVTTAGHHLKVETFPTCTMLVGDYDIIMDILKEAMAWSHGEAGKAVFVAKFIPGYQAD